jgi:regulator of sigma E protease
MNIRQVSIGTGKVLLRKVDKLGTEWVVKLYPLRAHVYIDEYHPGLGKTYWKQLLVVLAGPLSNFLLPFFLFFLFLLTVGKPIIPTILTGSEPGMPAYEAGLRPGDKIVKINNIDVESMTEIKDLTENIKDESISIEYIREDKLLEVDVKPLWASYKDINGVVRSHSVLGFLNIQTPLSFRWVASVAGVDVENEDHARELIVQNLGQETTFGLKSHDRHVHVHVIRLNKDLNKHLYDPDHIDYDYFYIGNLGDHVYQRLNLAETLQESGHRSFSLFTNIAKIPFNLFPFDREWITPGVTVSHRSSPIGRHLYILVFVTSLISVLIGWINLIPLPGLDGSVILINTVEAISGKELTRKARAYVILGAVLALYLVVFASNAPSLYSYFEFLMEESFK